MNATKTVTSILTLLDKYMEFVSGVSEEEFQKSPSEAVWSYSEVYSHVLQVNRSASIAIERCAFGNKSSTGRLSWKAWLVLLFGRFPGKLKAPVQIAAMVRKISLEDARNDIIKFQEKLPDLISTVKGAPVKNKINHPRLGMLNAQQWLRFIEVHTLHHLKQLKRINAMLAAHKPEII
jgi:hypothetical protein